MNLFETFTFHGVKFFNGTSDELKIFFRSHLKNQSSKKTIFIATPNPEFYVQCVLDKNFLSILKKVSFNVVDGIGLHVFLKLCGFPSSRITGSGIVRDLLENNVGSIYLLGGMNGVYELIAKRFKNITLVGGYDGIVDESNTKALCKEINNLGPDFLLVGLGAPKQERWIYDNIQDLSNVKFAIGIGGSLDFASEQVKRAPKYIQTVGLEWLFRLFQQPRRLPRIVNAVIVFPLLFTTVEVFSFILRIFKR